MHGWVPVDGVLNLRSPELLDNLGDRLIGVSVLEPGIFADTRTIEGLGVSVGFSVREPPDLNGDGQQDLCSGYSKRTRDLPPDRNQIG